MKIGRLKKIYIYLHMKYCKITGRKMIEKDSGVTRYKTLLKILPKIAMNKEEYTAFYKYKNKVGYFINATGFNKRDCIDKVRTIVFHSNFFDGLKDKKDIQVIVIENEG